MPSRKGQLSGRLTRDGRPGSRQRIPLVAALVFLLLFSSLGLATAAGSTRAASPPGVSVASLTDNQKISLLVGSVNHTFVDSVVIKSVSTTVRSYEITLQANIPLPLDLVNLSTSPVTQWADPNQVPGGPDNLPSLSEWSWTVLRGQTSDTANWVVDAGAGLLNRTVTWTNATFTVTGSSAPSVAVQVTPGKADGPVAPELGFVVGSQVPTSDPAFTALAKALDPGVVRFTQLYDAPATWDNKTGTVSFDFTEFGILMNFSRAVGAQVYLSLPAGSWGDGNLLPAGMPLNTSFWVNYWGHSSGYFPTLASYQTYLTTFVEDVKAHGWNIEYWNVGNEVPVGVNKSTAAAFVTLFNAAAVDIHSVLPSALVGSDVFTWPTKESYFAGALHGVGFLAFHDYPATGLCANAATYCVPDNVKGYLTDAQIL